jgi:PAS domain S-box-containing protein
VNNLEREISYKEIEKDLADLDKALKTITAVEKSINNIIQNVNFQATKLQKREAELEESNEFNRLLVENLPAAIWMGDEEGKCRLVNKEFTRVLGWTKEELMGIKTPDAPFLCERGLPYMKEGTLETLRKIWNKTIERKKSTTGEVPWLAKDGRVVIVKLVQIPYGKGESRLAAWVDVTEIRKRELELSKTLSALRDVVDKVVQKGELNTRINVSKLSGKYKQIGEDINLMIDSLQSNIEELRQALGSYSEVLGKVALGDLTARVNTSQLKGEHKLLGETLNSIVSFLEYDTKELKRGEAELNQTVLVCGEVLDKVTQQGDISSRIDVSKLSGKYKRIGSDINLLISGLQAKMEESKKREIEAKQAKDQLDLIVETSPAPIALTDEKGRFVKVNRALERIVGYDRREILGKTSFEQPFHTKETIDALKKLWILTIEHRKEATEGADIPWKTKDGKTVIIKGVEVPFGKGEGRLFAGI